MSVDESLLLLVPSLSKAQFGSRGLGFGDWQTDDEADVSCGLASRGWRAGLEGSSVLLGLIDAAPGAVGPS